MPSVAEKLSIELDQAERKAVDALGRYKFQMFGYWAAIWVHLNRLSGEKRRNPFACFVVEAKRISGLNCGAGSVDTFEIERCAKETQHALVVGTGFCRCTAFMFDSDEPILPRAGEI